MTGPDPIKKEATATLSLNRPKKTVSYTKTIPGEQKKKEIVKRKPVVQSQGSPSPSPVVRKKVVSSTPDRTTSVHVETPPSQPLVLKTNIGGGENAPARKSPDPIVETHKERRKVRRLITTRDGSGIGAKKGQSLGNKVQRTKDKIKRLVKPTMGGTDYYATSSSGKSSSISKDQYRALKGALGGVRRPL